MKLSIILIIFIILIAGCVEDKTTIRIPDHNQDYAFSNNIYDALQVKADHEEEIRDRLRISGNISVIYDGSSAEDNNYFKVVLINTLMKIRTYNVYEGRNFMFPESNFYYYIDDQWYNNIGENITEPVINGTVLRLYGPHTGATETSVMLNGNEIIIQGTSYKHLTLAGDKLVLIVFDLDI